MNSSDNLGISPDMFGAVCLFIKEVSKQQRKRIRARRQYQVLDSFLQEGTTVPALQQLKKGECLSLKQSQNEEEAIVQVAKRLRSSYQEDMKEASMDIIDTKKSARRFFQDILPAEFNTQGQKAVDIFNAYCRAADNKESTKPTRNRKRKIRSQ
jgi:hypothetical protein